MKGCPLQLLLLQGSALFCLLFASNPTTAQIVPDATLPNNSTVRLQGTTNIIEGGTTAGGNLFHSFREFSVPTGGAAFFNNALDIQNIFSRVTGSSISNIDGLIRANGTANLFLLNPNGIIFGPNARLNIGGSFLASTANSLRFADGTEFSVTNPQAVPLLTVNVPIGLQFGSNPGSIINRSEVTDSRGRPVGLQVQPGETLALLGGDVVLEGGILIAEQIELGGVQGGGQVSLTLTDKGFALSYENVQNFQDIQLSLGAYVSGLGDNTGDNVLFDNKAQVQGRQVRVSNDDLSITSRSSSSIISDILVVTASELVEISNSSLSSFGDLILTTGQLIVRDGFVSGNKVQVQGRQVRVIDRSTILFLESLVVNASELVEISGSSTLSDRSLYASGNLTIATGKLTVQDGSQVNVSGNLTVNASESVEVIGVDTANISSRLSTSTTDTRAAGDLTITTGKLTVQDKAQIVTNSSGAGNAGDLIIQASDSVEVGNEAQILTYTLGNGDTGDLIIRASNSVAVRNEGGIFALTTPGSQGAGGNLTIETQRFDGTLPIAISLGHGEAGRLTMINVESLPSIEGQILPDQTLPIKSTARTDLNTILIEGGMQFGSNLFHSFAQFSVPAGSTAYFNNAPEVENIISRVTGESISKIEGVLQANGKANLFLLNPNGIIFGHNALLDIGGSFVASTASRLNFADGTFFSAMVSQTSPPLTMSVPSGLQFEIKAGSIVNQARLLDIGFQVKPGETLALVGGEVRLDGGILQALGGRVELGGVAGLGTVELSAEGSNLHLSFPEEVQRADVSLTNQARVNVTAGLSGNIALNAHNIELKQSSLESGKAFVVDRAGNITLNATGDIFLTTAELQAPGGLGEINIQADSLFSTGSGLTVSDFGGIAGNISMLADNSISLADTNLGSLAGFGEASGSITIQAKSISLTDGSIVNVASTRGVSGGVTLKASDSVSLSESEIRADGGTAITVLSPGNAGVINITTGSLSLTNGARLTTNTLGQGKAGSIIINARNTVSFDGVNSDESYRLRFFGLSSDAISSGAFSRVQEKAMGDGGIIDITADSLKITNGAELSATSIGNGAAGNINVKVDSIVLNNQASISSNTKGGQGNINLQASFLLLSRGSRITSNATGSNIVGGNINIDSDVLTALENSDISANSDNFVGGNLTINAQGIFGTEPREALTSRSDITATGTISSGNITLNTPDVDPRNGLVELPANLVDATNQFVPECPTGTRFADNEFFITGRGGIPPGPRELLGNNAIGIGWVTPQPQEQSSTRVGEQRSRETAKPPTPTEITEAQGWVIGAKGEVILTAAASTPTPHSSWHRPTDCRLPHSASQR